MLGICSASKRQPKWGQLWLPLKGGVLCHRSPAPGANRWPPLAPPVQVHPSPSRVPVNLDESRAPSSRPSIAYPDICFAVDNFSDALQSLVGLLRLWAHGVPVSAAAVLLAPRRLHAG